MAGMAEISSFIGIASSAISILEATRVICLITEAAKVLPAQLREIREILSDAQQTSEEARISLEKLEKQPLDEAQDNEHRVYRLHNQKMEAAEWPRQLGCTCTSPAYQHNSADLSRHWASWKDRRDVSSTKEHWLFGRVHTHSLINHTSKTTFSLPDHLDTIRKLVADFQCKIQAEVPNGRVDKKLPCKVLEHAMISGGDCCEDCRGVRRSRRAMSATQVVRLAGGTTMLYPVCMLIMSNYTIEIATFGGRNNGAAPGSVVKQSMKVPEALANVSQNTAVTQIIPEILSHPSEPLFCAASMMWAFLEWAYYQSNVDDKYQIAILCAASMLGFVPFLGSELDLFTVLLCTVPWAIHLGLLASDALHVIERVGK